VNVQLTDFGVTLFNASSLPPILNIYKLGSDFNFLPSESDTDIHGVQVGPVGGIPSLPEALTGNLIRYSVFLDNSVGPFDFGNVGLFLGTNLVGLAASTTPITKINDTTTPGNSLRIDMYISLVGTNYEAWADLAESNNRFQVARLSSPDVMPPAKDSTPNMYVISGADTTQSSILAYTDREGLWNFDSYQFSSVLSAPIVGFDSESVTIANADFSSDLTPSYFGQLILQFVTGSLYSICRYIKTVVVNAQTTTLGFNTPLAIEPIVGDKFQVFKRNAATVASSLPIATAVTLGAIKIGRGLVVQPDGTCSIDPTLLGMVTSVNGQTGAVVVNAANLPGLSRVGQTGLYSDLIGAPPPYVLPPMSTSVRGGARLGPSGNLTIFGIDQLDLSFQPVKAVNGFIPDGNGLVTVPINAIGLVNPQAIPLGVSLDSYTTTGLFTVTAAVAAVLGSAPSEEAATLEVVPLSVTGTGDSVQRWSTMTSMFWRKSTNGVWGPWNQVANSVIATTTSLGVIKVGSGLAIAVDGTLSSAYNLPIASGAVLGGVRIGAGLTVDQFGTISVTQTLPIATTTLLGGVKVGSGLNVQTDGTLSVALPIATSSSLGVIKVGSGLLVQADGTLSTNFQLPTASSSVLGGIKIGTGLSIDANGVVSASSTYTLPIASSSVLGGFKVGSGLSIDANGVLTATTSYNLPIATASILGGVKVGSGLNVDGTGVLSVALPIATTSSLGVIKVGTGLTIDGNGVLSSTGGYTLPIASTTLLGGVKVGTGLTIGGDGTLNVSSTYTLPPATALTLGGVKVGTGINLAGDGTISVTPVDVSGKLNIVSGVAQGLQLKVNAIGTIGSSVPGNLVTANVNSATFTGGAATWTFSGFVAGAYGEIEFFLTNAGLATHAFPAAVHWVNPDGTTTTSFTTYIGNQRTGATNFQTSGTDFAIFWSIDGGTTIFARVM